MGTIISIPIVLLINKLIKLNKDINGRWISYINVLLKLVFNRQTKRLNTHNIWINDSRHLGILPFDHEWGFAKPSKKSENIFIYGVNSSQQSLFLNLKWRPNCIDNSVTADLKFRIDDNDGNYYTLNEETKVECRDNEYRACGLGLEVMSPFRRYRIKFRGYLKKNGKQLVYVKIRFLWLALSSVYDYQNDYNKYFMAKEIANSPKSKSLYLEDRIEQFGQIKGTFKVENENEKMFYLWSCNSKKYLPTKLLDRKIVKICGYNKKGLAFNIGIVIMNSNESNFYYRFGHLFATSGRNYQLTDLSLSNVDFENLSQTSLIKFSAKFEEKEIEVEIKPGNGFYHKLLINGQEGLCFVMKETDNEIQKSKTKYNNLNNRKELSIALSFSEESAKSVDLCGGKGSSLAQLKHLSNQLLRNKSTNRFVVPNGIVVTTNAYQQLLNETGLESEIIKLEKLAFSQSKDNLKAECENLVNLISNKNMPKNIELKIKEKLKQAFGDIDNKLFAVRSSAFGEDSEEMSAAGQMTTYLGVKGFEEIIKSVMKCWSSQFAFIPVEYRRGYGQLINSPMAVVIQEMVDCDSAGVIFTCDPNTGDERFITVTANYGLGETVVSASADPDTIKLSVHINANSLLIARSINKIESKQIGSKRSVMRLTETGGTVEQPLIDKNNCCISDNDLLRLGDIAVKIHEYYGNARDIEWGIKGDQIVMLQSRPITNLDNSFTEYEIMHEMDSAHNSEHEIYSRAHWGENFPGSASWNTFGITLRNAGTFHRTQIQEGLKTEQEYNPYVNAMGVQINQLMFNLTTGVFEVFNGYPYKNIAKQLVLAFFGHHVDDADLLAVWDDKDKNQKIKSLKSRITNFLNIPYILLFSATNLFKTIDEFKNVRKYDIVSEMKYMDTSKQMYELLLEKMVTDAGFKNHSQVSIASSIKNTLLRLVLERSKTPENNESVIDTDFNLLISSCNDVVSAEVPNLLREIAKSIGDKQNFINVSDNDALQLLINGSDTTSQKFRQFLDRHGHRGYREVDAMYLPWADDPIPCIKTIKLILMGGESALKQKQAKTVDEVMSELKTPLSFLKRALIRNILLPLSRNGVGYREHSKSFIIWMLNKMRQSHWFLARKMVEEGLLPETDLYFYLTAEEIQKLCAQCRDPLIVARAKLRKRTYPKMNKFKFEEIIKGPDMKPRNLDDIPPIDTTRTGCIKMTGTPISNGKIKARVCVAEDITDADQIQCGDILVTYSTDIGWSPYFPLLSGIVTEIGGTISHGAVIAREYGIPCLICVEGACHIFKTGDICVLDTETAQIYTIS